MFNHRILTNKNNNCIQNKDVVGHCYDWHWTHYHCLATNTIRCRTMTMSAVSIIAMSNYIFVLYAIIIFYLLGFLWLNTNIMELLFYVMQDLEVLLVVHRFRSAGQDRERKRMCWTYICSPWMGMKWMAVIKSLKPPQKSVSIELYSLYIYIYIVTWQSWHPLNGAKKLLS